MSTTEEIPEAEVVGQEVAVRETVSPQTIFRTDDPMEIMKRTSEVAGALKEFVKSQGLTMKISNRDYLLVDAWQMLGTMLGVTPGRVTTKPVEDGWEAIVELHDRTGRVVGMGEAECLVSEKTWKNRDDYARKSMAQTRAVGKAYRNTFGFIAKAAGYEATPAEEMPREEQPSSNGAAPASEGKLLNAQQRSRVIKGIEASDNRVDLVLKAVGVDDPAELTDVHSQEIRALLDGPPSDAPAEPIADDPDAS